MPPLPVNPVASQYTSRQRSVGAKSKQPEGEDSDLDLEEDDFDPDEHEDSEINTFYPKEILDERVVGVGKKAERQYLLSWYPSWLDSKTYKQMCKQKGRAVVLLKEYKGPPVRFWVELGAAWEKAAEYDTEGCYSSLVERWKQKKCTKNDQ